MRPAGRARRRPRPRCSTQQRELVEELGGTYHEVVGADIGEALVEAARSLNATQIVMGASRRSRWQRLTRGSVIGRVIRESGSGSTSTSSATPRARRGRLRRPPQRAGRPRCRAGASLIGFALAAVGLPLLTVVLAQLRDELGLPSVLLLFLLLVVGVSAVGGLWPALVAAVGGFLLVNWYFTPPLYTFTIAEGENVLALVVFLAVAGDRQRLRRARRPARRRGRRAPAPRRRRSRRLAGSSPASAVLESLRRVLGLDGAAVLHRDERRLADRGGERRPRAREPGGGARRRSSSTTTHVLALAGAPIRSEDERVLDAFAKELAASVELGELEAEAETAGALAAANELRAALLSAVSHDLRTPLAAIKASVTSLLQDDVEWTPEARREFLETIDEETDRLNALVGNLLDMSRLQAGALEISAAPVGLEEVVPAALHSLGVARRRRRARRAGDAARACSPTPACSSARSRT